MERAIRAVQLVNAALPIEHRISVSSLLPSSHGGFSGAVSRSSGIYSPTGREETNTIYLEVVSRNDFHEEYPTVGTTWSFAANGGSASYIQIVDSAGTAGETAGDEVDRRVTMLMAHEIIHAMGLDGHVPPGMNSIMTEENTDALILDGTNQPLSILYPSDREALRILYSGHDPNSLGPWSDTSTHLHGNGPHTGFGVALRNGYAEPWAYGFLPPFDLEYNAGISGRATWSGRLLGYSSTQVVAGHAEIQVFMSNLRGQAAFTNLEQWPQGHAPGQVGSGTTWGDGDLRYFISVNGNTFSGTGGDDGVLTGIFTGSSHEGAAGTLERNDLTAAFGASRP